MGFFNEALKWRRARQRQMIADGLLKGAEMGAWQSAADNAPVGSVGAPGGLLQPQQSAYESGLDHPAITAAQFTPIGGLALGTGPLLANLYADPSSRTPWNIGSAALDVGLEALGPIGDAAKWMGKNALSGMAAIPAMTVFHGSPHKFQPAARIRNKETGKIYQTPIDPMEHPVYRMNPDKFEVISKHPEGAFDISKIGTGEGAQAYGHGLYVAENPDIAKHYAEGLAKQSHWRGGRQYEIHKGIWDDDTWTIMTGKMQADYPGARTGRQVAIDDLSEIPFSSRDEALAYLKQNEYVPEDALTALDTDDPYFMDVASLTVQDAAPHLYKVDLPDEHIERMLDWDAPLSEQPEAVREALAKTDWFPYAADQLERKYPTSNPTGNELYKWLLDDWMPDEASQLLRDAGIPGIKYLDGSSRAAGEGTRNYVVFDDSLLTILERE